ncbi:hypothetical protein SCHPADRAFT_891251 [Schizopora paradoxa]|uniref:Uncharacterized protein n=1 Tax=Schizopora paradoxa TaxID=27342 RepID=A0A0H2RJT6_9AGAM|nr:hypothetical protein SCHPADRAFT_891251 [Schizopora paradoxa]
MAHNSSGSRKRVDSGVGSSERSIIPLPLISTESLSSIDSNATAPNLEGAGRTVGLLYDFLGAMLEDFLNRVAQRRGGGPEAIASCIRNLAIDYYQERVANFRERQNLNVRHRFTSLSRSLTKEEVKSLNKLCKKLFKLTRSPNLSIQLKALEEITNLALDYPLLRQILAHTSYERYLEPKIKGHDVLLATSKMHNAVKESKVHDFWYQWSLILKYGWDRPGPFGNNAHEIVRNFTHRASVLLWFVWFFVSS